MDLNALTKNVSSTGMNVMENRTAKMELMNTATARPQKDSNEELKDRCKIREK